MEQVNLTCINCPIGCALTAEGGDGAGGKTVGAVTGNLCARGIAYAKAEVTNPTRMMASTVRLKNGVAAQLPVKTRSPIPKHLVGDSVKALAAIEITAPAKLGQIILENVCGTGVDVIATRTVGLLSGHQ